MQKISKFILYKLLGWKIENDFPRDIKKYIIIVAPHTSWLDFPISVLTRLSLGIMIHFLGKESLFKPPFGFVFRALGGIPVDRSKKNNLVVTVAKIFKEREEFRLALSPEGTRKKVKEWKTGFYYMAKEASVPVVMVKLDLKNKILKISKPYEITDNKNKDFIVFKAFLTKIN